MDIRYEYEFVLKPDHGFGYRKSVIELFLCLPILNMILTEAEFNVMRSACSAVGLRLCDIERIVYIEPEKVE